MSDYIKEKIEEAESKFVEPMDKDMRVIDANNEKYIFGKWSDLSNFLASSLQEMEERTREEERKIRLYDPNELKRQGSKILEDQRAIWKKAYELGYREGVHEGYNQKMNDVLSHKKESGEKECTCPEVSKFGHTADCLVYGTTKSPKKEDK